MAAPSCSVCGEPSVGFNCPRCGRQLCPFHALGANQRCDDCEAEYLKRRNRRRFAYWFICPFLLIWVLFSPAFLVALDAPSTGGLRAPTLGHPLPDLLVFVSLVSTTIGGCFIGARLFLLRRKFLRERHAGRR
jgi:hypothetical protein